MKTQFTRVALVLVLSFGPVGVNAEPTEFDGRFYEVIVQQGISWNTANNAANAKTFGGVQGHLATITFLEEDEFVESLRQEAILARPEVWVGGFQEAGSTEPGEGWMWINGEQIAAENTASPYTNWQVNEPNDLGGESNLGVGHSGIFGWNDERRLGNIGGYVVEYGDVVPASSCTGSGCSPSGPVQIIVLEESQPTPPGSTVVQNQVTVTDWRPAAGKCGRKPLIVFGDDPNLPNLKIPRHLCAADPSGDFVVLITEANGFEILNGTTVEVENESSEVGLNAPPCRISVSPGVDPTNQEEVVWQTTRRRNLAERHAIIVGDGCGSSRGRTRGLSYFAIGLKIDFGIDYTSNPEGVEQKLIRLTERKLRFLKLAVLKARPALRRRDFLKLLFLVNRSIWLFNQGNFEAALAKMESFLERVEIANFRTTNFNHFGNLRMRVGTLIFITAGRVIPQAP